MTFGSPKVAPLGFERPPETSGNTGVAGESGAESGALSSDSAPNATPDAPTDPELAAVVTAWPDLPPAIRAGIVALVKAGTPTGTEGEGR